jgi:virulence-associated protein VagC
MLTLSDCIRQWLNSNPYAISGYEIRAVNFGRFDIFRRCGVIPIARLIFQYNSYSRTNTAHLWAVDKKMDIPTHKELVGVFVCTGDKLIIEPIKSDSLDVPLELSAANPEFFEMVAKELRPYITFCRAKSELD